MDSNGKLAVKIMQDWRNQNKMLTTTLSGLADMYDEYTKEEICEMLTGLSEALDDFSKNLAQSIVNAEYSE